MPAPTYQVGQVIPPQPGDATRVQTEIFSDLNTKTPGISSRVYNISAVVRAIKTAITQPPWQRLFDISGFDPEAFLFRLSDEAIESEIQDYLFYISQDDPRWDVDRNNTKLMYFDKDNHIIVCQLAFTIAGSDSVYTFTGNIRI